MSTASLESGLGVVFISCQFLISCCRRRIFFLATGTGTFVWSPLLRYVLYWKKWPPKLAGKAGRMWSKDDRPWSLESFPFLLSFLLCCLLADSWMLWESGIPCSSFFLSILPDPLSSIIARSTCTLRVVEWKPTSNHIEITVGFFNLHRGHPVNVPIRSTMHLSSVIPANDTRESVFRHRNFPRHEWGSKLGPLAPEASA